MTKPTEISTGCGYHKDRTGNRSSTKWLHFNSARFSFFKLATMARNHTNESNSGIVNLINYKKSESCPAKRYLFTPPRVKGGFITDIS